MIRFAQGVFGEIRTLEMLNALVGSTGKELVLDWPSALRTGKLSLDTRALRGESHHFR